MKKLILLLTLLAGMVPAPAQTVYWRDALQPPAFEPPARRFRLMSLQLPGLRQDLFIADGAGDIVRLPLPEGADVPLILQPVRLLDPALQDANPGIRTYRARSDDGRYSGRVTVSDYGVWARIYTPEQRVAYIQPLRPGAPLWSLAYYADEATDPGLPCGVEADASAAGTESGGKTAAYSYADANLRRYRLSVVATGEYTVWAGGGTADQTAALAYITATVNNVAQVMERDNGITFTLNSPTSILFTDSTTDGFNRSASSANLTACSTALATNVGNLNYDIGHLFSAGFGGGLAGVGVACGSGKGRGESGAASPTGSYFDNVVMHELGHQYGATHTFSANNGGCSGNGSYTTGWEVGSGTSIMGYPNLCAPNNDPGGRRDFYHAGSLSQIGTYITVGTGSTCPVTSQPANAAPAISTATAVTIPHSTPFRLTASATDANNTALTYTFDQLDPIGGTTGSSTGPASTNTSGPMFRSFPPSASGTRYFPELAALYAAAPTPYEVLPSVSRSMNFRATVRDNNAGFGRTNTESVVVSTAACGPFAITSQGSATTLTANGSNTMTVTWNTAAACVTCPNVRLRYTRDRGITYTTLLESTANDGTETITVPNLPSCDGRLYLECTSVPFFSVTNAVISIGSSCGAEAATFSPETPLSAPSGSASLNQPLAAVYGTQIPSPITGTVNASDVAGTLTLYNSTNGSCINFGNATRYELLSFRPGTTGTYTFTGNVSRIYNLYETSFDEVTPCTNFLASSATYNGSTYSTGTTVSAALCKDRTYVLMISTTSIPTSYSIAVTGGAIYTGTPNPGAGFNYAYVIVNNSTGNIASIQSTGDMSNPAVFPAASYTVYGLSTGATALSLQSSFGGTSFSAFRTAVLNQSSGLCAALSFNSRSVQVTANPLPAYAIGFNAAPGNGRTARLSWTLQQPQPDLRLELQRSLDGVNFSTIATAPAAAGSHVDTAVPGTATEAYYRLLALRGTDRQWTSTMRRISFDAAPPAEALRVVPNPVSGLELRASLWATDAGPARICIVDATGRTIFCETIGTTSGLQELRLRPGTIPGGVYTLRVTGPGQQLQTRFIAETR